MAETYNENRGQKPHKLFKYGGLVFVILAFLSIVLFLLSQKILFKSDPNILAVVGNEKITQANLNEKIYSHDFVGSPASPSNVDIQTQKQYLQELIDNKVIEIEAGKYGIAVTDQEIDKEVRNRAAKYDQQTALQQAISKKSVKAALLREKLKDKILGWKEGSYIVVNYSKNFTSNMVGVSDEQRAKEDANRPQQMKEDTDYATTLINSIYADVKSGKITFEQGMEKAKNDPRFGIEAYKPSMILQSDVFTKTDFMNHNKIFSIETHDIEDTIDKTAPGQISQPIALKVEVPVGKDYSKTESKNGMWVIFKVDKGEVTQADSFDEWMAQKKKELKVNILKKTLAWSDQRDTPLLINEAEAHFGSHGCDQTDHFGVNTGLGSSTAGLVVITQYYDSSGNGPYLFNKNVNIFGHGGGIVWTPYGAYASGPGNGAMAFNTGSAYGYSGTNLGECSNYPTGYLVLGWGSTSSIGLYGHHGNGWTLSCNYNPFTVNFVATDQGPGAYGGYWDSTAQSFNVVNGSTTHLTFTWHANPPPTYPPIGYLESASCDASGNITVSGWSCDPDNYSQPIPIRFHYDVDSQAPFPADDYTLSPLNLVNFTSDYPPYSSLLRADISRSDVSASCGGYSNHGFNKTFPAQAELKDGRPHNITAFGLDWYPMSVDGNITGFVRHTWLRPTKTITCPTSFISSSCNLTPPSATIQEGDPVTLNWSISGTTATSFKLHSDHGRDQTITGANSSGTTSGTIEVIPTVNPTTYTLEDSSGRSLPGCSARAVIAVLNNKTGGSSPSAP